MFKFSMNWLKDYCGKSMTAEEIFSILNLQGFEFQGSENVCGDLVTAIEVKANRPDMLCHSGIAREIKAFKNEPLPLIPKFASKINNEKFKIEIKDETACKRFSILKLKNINNTGETPEHIRLRLEALGINLVNPVVDIINYVMFDLGQPMHCYDAKKLNGEQLEIKRAENNFKLETLNGEAEVKKGDILISSGEKTVCVAGIIGADIASVSHESTEILLEAAVFDEVSVRLTSRRLKISTPSSFRFERGVNIQNSFDILGICAKMITEVCGGEICEEGFDYYPKVKEPTIVKLSLKDTNLLLGTSLEAGQVTEYLERYGFSCESLNENEISVTIPAYRITVNREVELIGEIARIHGYDNIPEIMPKIQISYQKNQIWANRDKLRSLLLKLGFAETINYSFIPGNTMEALEIKESDIIYSDVTLQNPISQAYSLMRPTMVYSLLNCLAYNYSVKNSDIALFELGRTYFKDKSLDTGCKELGTCGFMMTGVKSPKGWGQAKDIKYDFYDLLSYLDVIMDNFGQKFTLEKADYKFCKEKAAYEIVVNGEKIGFIGQVNKQKFEPLVKNVKLIRDEIFYCEIRFDSLISADKKLKFESKYPPVKRLYNLLHSKDVSSKEISDAIMASSEVVRSAEVKDVYIDKNMPEDTHAVLYEVTYCSQTATLTTEEIEKIEASFINLVKEKYNAVLKG